jgi:hypothetical protein
MAESSPIHLVMVLGGRADLALCLYRAGEELGLLPIRKLLLSESSPHVDVDVVDKFIRFLL